MKKRKKFQQKVNGSRRSSKLLEANKYLAQWQKLCVMGKGSIQGPEWSINVRIYYGWREETKNYKYKQDNTRKNSSNKKIENYKWHNCYLTTQKKKPLFSFFSLSPFYLFLLFSFSLSSRREIERKEEDESVSFLWEKERIWIYIYGSICDKVNGPSFGIVKPITRTIKRMYEIA